MRFLAGVAKGKEESRIKTGAGIFQQPLLITLKLLDGRYRFFFRGSDLV
jgi:hypothetical protein